MMKNEKFMAYLLRLKVFFAARRPFLSGSIFEYIVIFAILLLIATIYMDFIPLTGLFSKIFTSGAGDATAGLVWANTVDNWSGVFASYTKMTNYPIGEDLTNPYIITSLLLWLPVRFFSYFLNPIAAVNIATVGGYVITGMSMYWLMKRITNSAWISFLAAYALAFYPYVTTKGTAHLAYIFNIFFVLVIASFLRLWFKPKKMSAILFGLAFGACFYFDGYFALLATALVGSLCLSGLLYIFLRGKSWNYLWCRLKCLLLSLAAFTLIILPIGIYSVSSIKDVNTDLASSRSDIAIEIPYYKSWVIDFLVPSKANPIIHSENLDQIQQYRLTRSDALSNTNYLGYVNIVLAACGIALFLSWLFHRKKSTVATMQPLDRDRFILLTVVFLVTSVVCFAFMFSPEIVVLGHTIKLPGYILIKLDISLWRNMSRFSGVLQVVLVPYGAYSLWLLCKYNSVLKRYSQKEKQLLVAGLCIVLVGLLTIEYANTFNMPVFDTKKPNKVYGWLRDQKDVKVIAELPIVDPLDETASIYTTMQLIHKKQMVNIKMPEHRVQSDTLGSVENPETIDWIRSRGAQVAIVHGLPKKCPTYSWGKVQLRDEQSETCVYRIIPKSTEDKLFAIYESGVDPTPNLQDGTKNTARLNNKTVVMGVTDNDFHKLKRQCSAKINTTLYDWNSANPVEGEWTLVQNNHTVARGHIGPTSSEITATVSCQGNITLNIERQNQGNDLLLQGLDVTEIK